MNKLIFSKNKNIRLNNVVYVKCNFNEITQGNLVIKKIENMLKVKGASPVGPLIQHTYFTNDDEPIKIEFMLQSNTYINNLDVPFKIESVIRVANCMYCRYSGPEEKQSIGYDKIKVEAFENDIELTGNTYTIYVDSNEEDGTVVIDIFMEKKV